MPAVKTTPEGLKPYRFHGVDISYSEGSDQAEGTCPFCGREGKFRVAVKTGLWDCKVCKVGTDNGGGNCYTFLRQLWIAAEGVRGDLLEQLALSKGVSVATLKAWGVVISPLTMEPLVPGYSPEGKLNNLYRYATFPGEEKPTLKSTSGVHHQLFGVPLYDPRKGEVLVTEGPWDGMAAWEVLNRSKWADQGGLTLSSEAASLGAKMNVLSVPGATTFPEVWAKSQLFSGKIVSLAYDNDHPRMNANGKLLPPTGTEGMKRAALALAKVEAPPTEIRYLRWGREGYSPTLPDGYDLRDVIGRGEMSDKRARLGPILRDIVRVPAEWLKGMSADSGKVGDMDLLPCKSWTELVGIWRKAMKWTPGLDNALAVMLACVASTKAVGDQLWVRVIGPASCGKSTLCEALSTNKKYVLAKSTIRGFHSGYKSGGDTSEDNSLISQLYGKTLITKDGDTLIQSQNLGQILAEARDLYDGTSRSHYRNAMGKDHQGVRVTWILCGTSSLRQLDTSELGERFLTIVIMEGIEEDLEDEILWRVANRSDRSLNYEADGKMETHHDPELVTAMAMTGGYVAYLRENAKDLLAEVTIEDEALRQCVRFGKFVAYMRARPSSKQEETAEREFAARLVSQHVRLAKCLAVVLNKKTVDAEILAKVAKVALDSSSGRTLELAKHLFKAGKVGAETRTLALFTNQGEDSERTFLRFLRRIGAVELFQPEPVRGMSSKPRWRLTDRMDRLYRSVFEGPATTEVVI